MDDAEKQLTTTENDKPQNDKPEEDALRRAIEPEFLKKLPPEARKVIEVGLSIMFFLGGAGSGFGIKSYMDRNK